MITNQVKNPYKTATMILSCILLLSLTGHYLTFRWNDSRESDLLVKNAALMNTIAINDHILAQEKAVSDSLKVQIKTNATKNEVALKVKEKAIATLSGKLAEKRKPVQLMIDTTELLKDFVDVYDSTNQAKDELILDMKLRHAAQLVDLNVLVESQSKQIMAAVTTGEAWRTAAEDAQKAATKATKGKKFWRTVSVAAAGGIAFLLLKPN